MTDNLPADWAIGEFKTRAMCDATIKDVKLDYLAGLRYAGAIIEGARLIEQHEERPVDPDLELTREIAAKLYPDQEQFFRSGVGDTFPALVRILAAIKHMKDK